jgi:DNA-binding ferritin-like protein (Dps family)
MVDFSKTSNELKSELLRYFRSRAAESLEDLKDKYGTEQYKKRARAINKEVNETREHLEEYLLQVANRSSWGNDQILPKILMLEHSKNVVILESRNDVWPYEYMAFSRRIGEIWEPFCRLCFEYAIRDIEFFVPPLFSDVKERLHQEIEEYIDQLNITDDQKTELKRYYDKVWSLVASGQIKLELDMHFQTEGGKMVNVDFKSGFSSNEKGNTNRLLMVATIYENIEKESYECTLLVRSEEDENNNYFQTLKNSGVWNAHCGDKAYSQIEEYTGFDLREWIGENINWQGDFKQETIEHIRSNDLDKYLIW